MRICVIGNSHVAALRLASLEPADTQVDFYAIPGGGGPSLRFARGRIFPLNDRATIKSTIPEVQAEGLLLDGYDAVILSGVGLTAARSSQKNVHAQLAAAAFLPAAEADRIDRQLVSQAVFAKVVEAELARMACCIALKNICRHFAGRVYVQLMPLPTAQVVQRSDFTLPYGDRTGAFFAWLYRLQSDVIASYRHSHPSIVLLELPDPAWLDQGFTPDEFQSGADAWHMNGAYGDRVLEGAINTIRQQG